MMNINPFLICLLSLILITPSILFSQTIDWVYEIKAKEKTIPQFFWVDSEGKGYYNIRQENPERPGDANFGSFLIMLDGNGQYQRTTKINNCNKSLKILPFGKNKLISSGYTCSKDFTTKDTRLFNLKGKTLKTRKSAFPGNYFATIPTEEGFTFFSKPTNRWSYTYISIGQIDKKMNLTYDKVPLKSIAREGFGIVNSFRDPAILPNGTWAIPFQYGKIHTGGQGIRPSHGIVLGIKDSKIIWQYPQELVKRKIESICNYKDKIAVLMSRSGGKYLFVTLNKDGELVNQLKLDAGQPTVKDLLVTNQKIIILCSNKIFWFSKSGKLIKEINLSDLGITNANRMQLINHSSIICTARKNGNAVIFRINQRRKYKLIEETDKELKTKTNDTIRTKVSYSSIDNNMANNIISATVYPNPTSSYINFEFDKKLDNQDSFLIYLFDSSGKLAAKNTFNEDNPQINIKFLPAGIYSYRIVAGNEEKLITGQIVKINN